MDKITYSSIVVPVLMEKIPDEIRFNIIRANEDDHLDWTLDKLIAALEKELKVRESHVPLKMHGAEQQRNSTTSRPKPEARMTANYM